jgi:polyphenol oxidase
VLDLDASSSGSRPVADAVITRRAGVVCCIMVADCMPVLFAARDGSVIGAAHAGWRGLAAGVLENTVQAMSGAGVELVAWLGPAIGPAKFEVGAEVRDVFVVQHAAASAAFVANEQGRWLCDLSALVRARLLTLGLTSIAGGDYCTASDSARFFSHRRDGNSGRMAALLWLTGTA